MVVTTGFFDGVHLGHRHILSCLKAKAAERGEESLVVTFWPHPRTVLQQDARELRLLSTLQEKCDLIRSIGIDRVEVLPFTREFAALDAAGYLRLLRERFGASLVLMGYDNRIGSDLLTATQLATYGGEALPAVEAVSSPVLASPDRQAKPGGSVRPCGAIPPISWAPPVHEAAGGHAALQASPDGLPISSTRIRKALADGDVALANAMLGYRYSLHGVVVAGNRMGRTIGFPTANMKLYEPLKLIPAGGVYAVDVETLGSTFRGMCNIGVRPTVGPGNALTVETNIFDFNEDIYGLDIVIRFIARIRDERRFDSLDALRAQLAIDKSACEKY